MSDELKIKLSSKEANQKLDKLEGRLKKTTGTKHKASFDIDIRSAKRKISVLKKEMKKLEALFAQNDRAKKAVGSKAPVVNKELEQLKKTQKEYEKTHKKEVGNLKKSTQEHVKKSNTIYRNQQDNQRKIRILFKETSDAELAAQKRIQNSLKKTAALKSNIRGLTGSKNRGYVNESIDAANARRKDSIDKTNPAMKDFYDYQMGQHKKGPMPAPTKIVQEGFKTRMANMLKKRFGPLISATKNLTQSLKSKEKYDTKAAKDTTKATQRATRATQATSKKKGKTTAKESAGKPDIINQLPQNPLLARFAQFGMMASGMAATLFLFQMIAAQLVNLMNVITGWQDSLLKLTDSFSLINEATEALPGLIRGYAREMGVSQTSMSEAMGGAMKYGIDPNEKNINSMYGLNFSDNTKGYKEAALIMSLAGTEFGDRAANQYMKKWEAYSGDGKSSGNFGYEWEKLKGSSKDAMVQVFSESDAKYGKSLTDSMRGLSDWITANRFTISSYFDSIVKAIKLIGKILKTIAPALIGFVSIFMVTNGMKLFLWTLTAMSKLLGPLQFGLVKTAEQMAAISNPKTIAIATMTGWIPALVGVGVAIAGWKIGKQIIQLGKLRSAIKEIEKYSGKDYINMSSAEKDQNRNDYSTFKERTNTSLNTELKRLADYELKKKNTKLKPGSYAVESIDRQIVTSKTKIKTLQSDLSKFTNAIKEVDKAAENEKAQKLGLILPKNIASVDEWKQGLERVNKELGYMPEMLKTIKDAQTGLDIPGNTATMGPGAQRVIELKEQFENNLKNDPAKKQAYDLALNEASLKAGGFNSADKSNFLFEAIKKTETFKTPESLLVFSKIFENFSTQSATIEITKFQNTLDGLNRSLKQFDMTTFGKKMNDIDRMKIGDGEKGQLKAVQKDLLTKKLDKKYKQWRSENVRLAGQKADIDKSNLPETQKTNMKKHLDYLDKAAKLQVRLSLEEEKGLQIKTKNQIWIEHNLKKGSLIDRRKNLGKGKDKYFDRDMKANSEKTDYQLELAKQQRLQLRGQNESLGIGYVSDMEKKSNIEIRYNELKRNLIIETGTIQNEAQTNTILAAAKIAIAREEEIKQLESLINKHSEYDNMSHSGMSDKTYKAKKDLINQRALEMSRSGRNPENYVRAADFDLEQEKLKAKIGAWEVYYSTKGVMTAEHYKNEQKIIEETYTRNTSNTSKMTKAMADLTKAEALYQLKLQNRKNLSLSEDLAVGIEQAERNIRQSYKTTGEILEITVGRAIEGVGDAMADWVLGTKSASEAFKDMARNIISDLTRMIIKQEIYNMVLGSGGTTGGSGGGIFGFFSSLISSINANGNVVSGISDYRNQIVSKPTIVPNTRLHAYASGGALFGEAGPEAIMPLTRMASGNLGVATSGGGSAAPNVQINITNNGKDVEATQEKQPEFDGEKWVIGIVLDHASNNKGNFKTSMKGILTT